MATHLVCLTFDFDNVAPAVARGMTTPTMMSRGHFGVVGAERILELLKQRGIRSTWFIPGHTIVTYPDVCQAVHAAGHEIGHHGWTHRPPAGLTRDEEDEELARGNQTIGELTGRVARGYRSPMVWLPRASSSSSSSRVRPAGGRWVQPWWPISWPAACTAWQTSG